MKQLFALAFVCYAFFLAGCGGGGPGGDPFNPSLTFYSGSYSGTDSGTFRLSIDSRGDVSGEATSDDSGMTFSLSGSASGNQVTFAASPGTDAPTFTGTINGDTGAISGTWRNASGTQSGSFTARSS